MGNNYNDHKNDNKNANANDDNIIRYVSHVTKTRDAREPGGGLVYIGHSMGTTAFWVMADLRPEVTDSDSDVDDESDHDDNDSDHDDNVR